MMTGQSYEQFKRDYYTMTGTMARLAMADKAKKGIYPLRLPIGYKRVFVEGEERIDVDSISGPLVRLAFELAARKRTSLTKILKLVQAKGLKGHFGELISRSALHRLLRNRFYAGELRYRSIIRSECHHALVSRSLFERAKMSLESRVRS